jgi:5-methylthioadenosine/S-adenosylhomocysteine deaminase
VTAATALDLVTLGAARALGIETEIGSLDVGKAADLAAFPLNVSRSAPVYDPATALVFSSAGRQATFVAVAGRPLVRDGRLVGDAADAPSIDAVARALAAWSATDTGTTTAPVPANR